MPPAENARPKPTRLHELLAVRTSLETQAGTTTNGLAGTFEKKQHLFTGRLKSFAPFGETAIAKTEEQVDIQTGVLTELAWLKQHVIPWIDNILHIAEGNTDAKADIILDNGLVIATNIPTSALLDFERLIDGLRQFALKIPTLDPAKSFAPAPDKGANIYAARPVEKVRREKRRKVIVLSPATDRHPAQVQLVEEDEPTGTIQEQEWSSMITPAQKAEILARIENLARATKRARQRANTAIVDLDHKVGEEMYRYAFGV